MILTLSVLFPDITESQILWILVGGSIVSLVIAICGSIAKYVRVPGEVAEAVSSLGFDESDQVGPWRMPPLENLPPVQLTVLSRVWLFVLRAYVIVAAGLVLVRIVLLATGHA